MTAVDFEAFVDELAAVAGETILPFFRNSETSRMDARNRIRRLAPPQAGCPCRQAVAWHGHI